MPYGKDKNIKDSNIDYNNKDFNDLKASLINYTKAYFPNTYKDFNETSPGMMLLELNAYVGDVLNFYIDQQYKEMMLPLAEERKSVVQLAKGVGYKISPTSPSYALLDVSTVVGVDNNSKPNFNDSRCVVIDEGMQVNSPSKANIIFETLDVIDFKTSSSIDLEPVVETVDDTTGLPTSYRLTRQVKAISGETKTTTFNCGSPEKFKRLTLNETNVIEILKCVDSNNNKWHEVESLAQDKIPLQKHYTSDLNRSSAYISNGNSVKTPIPYSLEYIKTSKRFVKDVGTDNKTSLIFGNGILKNGNTFGSTFLAVEQVGINLPGGEENLETDIDPLLGDSYGTLGESPTNTILTVTYRVGGGVNSNLKSNTLTNINSYSLLGGGNIGSLSVTNKEPAAGGSSGESLEQIRERALIHGSTQNRCVTKEDYEARTLTMPSKFGNLAKVYCVRAGSIRTAQREKIQSLVDRLKKVIDISYDMFDPGTQVGENMALMEDLKLTLDADQSGGLNREDFQVLLETLDLTYQNVSEDDRLYTVDLYLLSYDNQKNLINTPFAIKQNLKQYLNQYRLLTDQVSFYDGFVINFGVIFDVIGIKGENKDEIKIRCIDALRNYFTIDKMQFKQIIYNSEVENLLMDVEGVQAVNYVTMTQDRDYNSLAEGKGSTKSVFSPPLYNTVIQSDGSTSDTGNDNYGYYYDFSQFYGNDSVAGKGIILPSYEPAIFELKFPNQNIKGIVR